MIIPADVPRIARADFAKNYHLLTKGTDRLFLFSADHKIEHLDEDFAGPDIDKSAHDPRHLFEIAQRSPIGGMATQCGLIARYACEYPTVSYVAKLTSKTNMIPTDDKDPLNGQLWTVDDVLSLKKETNLTIAGIGLTVYIGSEYEDSMLRNAAQSIMHAHKHGLVTILWMYPRGKVVQKERTSDLLAGAVGVGAALGADFVKIHAPQTIESLPFVVEAAGNTKVLCAGGSVTNPEKLLDTVKKQITLGKISGVAIGRSIFTHSLTDAIALCQKLSKIIYLP